MKYAAVLPGRQSGQLIKLAQWQFLTGRKKAGMAAMEKLVPELSGVAEAWR